MWRLTILLLLIVTACKDKGEMITAMDLQKQLERSQQPVKDDSMSVIPPLPPDPFYLNLNFIIDEEGKTYFYRTGKPPLTYSCGTGMEDADTRPEFIYLTPEKIKEIPASDFETTFYEYTRPRYGKMFFNLASAKDTFYSAQWSKLLRHASTDKKTHWLWVIRKMTQEERIVLNYKKSGEYYDPKTIVWDTTKIVLPEYLK